MKEHKKEALKQLIQGVACISLAIFIGIMLRGCDAI